FAHSGVRISVGASRYRDGACHLGIAEARKAASNPDQYHRYGHCGTGVQRRGLACQHKDPRADDGANTERDQVDGSERALQAVFAALLCLAEQLRHWLSSEKVRHPLSSVVS